MVKRVCITHMRDGYGDLIHLIKVAAIMANNQTTFSQHPVQFIVICDDKKIPFVLEKLKSLPTSHPLFYEEKKANKNPWVIKASDVDNEIKKIDDVLSNAIIYSISTPYQVGLRGGFNRVNPTYHTKHGLLINIGEHGAVCFQSNPAYTLDCIFNRHLGFAEEPNSGQGLFLEEVIKPDQTKKINLWKTLPVDLQEKIQKGISEADDISIAKSLDGMLIIPGYIQNNVFLNAIFKLILCSPLAQNKNVVFFITTNSESETLKIDPDIETIIKSKNCVVILNNSYVEEKVLNVFKALNTGVRICSGDSSLEESFSAKVIPILQIKDNKRETYRTMFNIIATFSRKEKYHEDAALRLRRFFQFLLNFDPDQMRHYHDLLTQEVCDYFEKVCTDLIQKDYNFTQHLPKIEEESILFYEMLYEKDIATLEEKIIKFEKTLKDEYEFYNLLVILGFYYQFEHDEYLNLLKNLLIFSSSELQNSLIALLSSRDYKDFIHLNHVSLIAAHDILIALIIEKLFYPQNKVEEINKIFNLLDYHQPN